MENQIPKIGDHVLLAPIRGIRFKGIVHAVDVDFRRLTVVGFNPDVDPDFKADAETKEFLFDDLLQINGRYVLRRLLNEGEQHQQLPALIQTAGLSQDAGLTEQADVLWHLLIRTTALASEGRESIVNLHMTALRAAAAGLADQGADADLLLAAGSLMDYAVATANRKQSNSVAFRNEMYVRRRLLKASYSELVSMFNEKGLALTDQQTDYPDS